MKRKLNENINTLKQKVRDWVYDKLGEDFEDALASEVHDVIPEYETEWCTAITTNRYEKAREVFLDAVVDELFGEYQN